MIITLVTDQFYQNNHGTSVSAQRLYQGLVENGHEVRVLTIDDGTNTPYALKERGFGKPIDKVIHSQGMQLAKPDREIIVKAVSGADVVHILIPFKLGYTTIKVCRELNIPCTAAFHIAPENITATLHLNRLRFVDWLIMRRWYNTTYKHVSHIHCPSEMIARQIEKQGFNAKKYVISNGYDNVFRMNREEKPTIYKDKYIVVVNGRLSREKRFDVVIKAINKSKYRGRILLILGGIGPLKSRLMNMAKKLPNFPIFLGSYNREQQLSFLNFADLYIHSADIEIEGMTCIEAIACGCVPIVSDSRKSAAAQFVAHKQSRFLHGNHIDLASKIDWWIEHPNELQSQREAVVRHAQNYTVERSMDSYIRMFKTAVAEYGKVEGAQVQSYDYSSKDVYCLAEQFEPLKTH